MAKFYYFDKNGTKYGPVTIEQVQYLALNGVIESQTPMENEKGQRGMAGQLQGIQWSQIRTAAPVPPLAPPKSTEAEANGLLQKCDALLTDIRNFQASHKTEREKVIVQVEGAAGILGAIIGAALGSTIFGIFILLILVIYFASKEDGAGTGCGIGCGGIVAFIVLAFIGTISTTAEIIVWFIFIAIGFFVGFAIGQTCVKDIAEKIYPWRPSCTFQKTVVNQLTQNPINHAICRIWRRIKRFFSQKAKSDNKKRLLKRPYFKYFIHCKFLESAGPSYNVFEGGSVESVKFFVEREGIDVSAGDEKGKTPLHHAARSNPNVDVLKYLVSQGASVNARDELDSTPLFDAAFGNSNVEVLKYLVAQGASVNTTAKFDYSLLHSAVENNNIEVVRYVVSLGGNVNAPNHEGKTPFHLAAQCNPNVDVLKYLVYLGADINARATALRKTLRVNAKLWIQKSLMERTYRYSRLKDSLQSGGQKSRKSNWEKS